MPYGVFFVDADSDSDPDSDPDCAPPTNRNRLSEPFLQKKAAAAALFIRRQWGLMPTVLGSLSSPMTMA
jgi:hypothetical protein